MKDIRVFYLIFFFFIQFLEMKFSIYLNRHVFVLSLNLNKFMLLLADVSKTTGCVPPDLCLHGLLRLFCPNS